MAHLSSQWFPQFLQRCSKWSPNEAAGEEAPEAYLRRYVEDAFKPRTKLGAIFSIVKNKKAFFQGLL
jgi:hypothetical protein